MIVHAATLRASALRGDTRYPYAAWMPIPEAAHQPTILPRLLILHSQAGPKMTSLENLHAYISRDDVHIEPTFILDMDGRMAQLVDIFTRADCSAKANGFSTSVETQDHGSATLATTRWTDQQIEQLAGLAAWMHLHPSIRLPLSLAKRWDGDGVGPHRQFPEWSVYVGKTCPGNTRVAQIPLVLSRAEALVATPPVSEEDDMPAPDPQLIRFRGYANELLYACNTFTHVTAEQIDEWREAYGTDDGRAHVWEAHPQAMKGAFVKAGLDVDVDAAPTPDGS